MSNIITEQLGLDGKLETKPKRKSRARRIESQVDSDGKPRTKKAESAVQSESAPAEEPQGKSIAELAVFKPQVRLRGMHQHAVNGTVCTDENLTEAFAAALGIENYEEPDPVIEWSGTEELAALDIDFHGEYKPERHRLEYYGSWVEPRPAYWWITHGDGLRLIYFAARPFTAEELAAIAALWIKGKADPSGLEIKSETRHPAYVRSADGNRCGEVHRNEHYQPDWQEIRKAIFGKSGDWDLSEEETEQWISWLSHRGMEIGKRYDHTHCPIAPSSSSHDQRNPVKVGDSGILCYVCRGKAGKGWRSAKQLLDIDSDPTTQPVIETIKGRMHWEQARPIVVPGLGVPEPIAMQIYSAGLKMCHLPDDASDEHRDAIKKMAWNLINVRRPFVRVGVQWVLSSDYCTPVPDKALTKFLENHPAAKYWDGKEMKIDQNKIAQLLLPESLEEIGVFAHTPIRGFDLAERARDVLQMEQQVFGTTYEPIYPVLVPAKPPIKYIPKSEQDIKKAMSHLEKNFPGIPWQYALLIAGIIAVKQLGREHLPPVVFVSGPTDSAKTGTVLLIAMLFGQFVSVHQLPADKRQQLEAYKDGSDRCIIILFDEILKQGASIADIESFILNAHAGTRFHENHGRQVCVDNAGALILCDTGEPTELMRSHQVARRAGYVKLPERKGAKWENTCGCRDLEEWRKASPENERTADTFVSWFYDTYCQEPDMLTFDAMLKAFGFTRMENSISRQETDEALRALFLTAHDNEACRDHGGNALQQRSHWLVVTSAQMATESKTPLAEALDNVGIRVDDKSTHQRLNEAQWRRITGLGNLNFKLEVDSKQRIKLRFWTGTIGNPGVKYNSEIELPVGGLASAPAEVAAEVPDIVSLQSYWAPAPTPEPEAA
jgi:hypothetical protein